MGGGHFPRGYSDHGVKLTTHLLPAPRLRMRGAIPPLPICLHSVVSTETVLFYFTLPNFTLLRLTLFYFTLITLRTS